jgi:uncharacterized membrane protein HdeD (DUF308 family)
VYVRRDDALDIASGMSSLSLIVLLHYGAGGPARLLLTLLFAFFVPGRAIVTNWPVMAAWSEIGMSLLISLVVVTLVATVTLWMHIWNPLAVFEVEAWLSIVGLSYALARRRQLDLAQDRELGDMNAGRYEN